LSAVVTDTCTSDDGNAFKVRKGTGRRMKKHRVKLKSEVNKKSSNEFCSSPDSQEDCGDRVGVEPQEAETEAVIHPIVEPAIQQLSEPNNPVDSSQRDSRPQIQENNKAGDIVNKESSIEPEESWDNDELKNDGEYSKEEEESCDQKESENFVPAESGVHCDAHIQNIILEVTDNGDENSDDDSDRIQSTDL
jgi:hypothetical protein